MTKKASHADAALIEMLGGTKVVEQLCGVTAAAVSNWRMGGIPKARRMYLQAKKPKVFAQFQREQEKVPA